MGATAQVRLDEETRATLEKIVKRTGLTRSEVLREGIRVLEQTHLNRRKPRLIGAGEFDSGLADLSTNPKYMEGFGDTRRPIGGKSR